MNITKMRTHLIPLILASTLLTGCTALAVSGAATGVSVVHDRRTAGTVIDDQGIEFQTLKVLYGDESIRVNTHINATSYNRLLLVTGEAPTEALRSHIINKLRQIPNIQKIQNEIIIAAPSALVSRSSDAIITSNVKLSLFKLNSIQGFDPTRVKVVTENGIVYLLGLLRPHEAQAVVDLVSRTSGVQRVIKLFEHSS